MSQPDHRSTTDEVDHLLSGRTRDIRLSPQLLVAFRQRSFKQTSKIIRSWMVWVVVLDLLAVVSNWLLLPRDAALAMLVPALLIPPAAALVYIFWSRRLPFVLLDYVLMAGMMVILLAVALMGYAAGPELQERYLSIMLFVGVTAVIIFAVPQLVTQTIAGIAMGLYLFFQLAHPSIGIASAVSAFLFFASGVASTVVARRTMTILAHRTFLLELRDARRVAELAATNAQLERLSRTDALTGLPNRRYIDEVLATLFGPERSQRRPIAMLMCDIDCFKSLNDRLGHLEGDKALAAVSNAIASVLHPQNHLARFGGEEFIVVLVDVTADEAQAAAEIIRESVQALGIPNPGSSAAPVVTVSIGAVAERDFPGFTATQLQQAADEALYLAKYRGRNRVVRQPEPAKVLSLAHLHPAEDSLSGRAGQLRL